MKKIFIAATKQNDGKTTLALGLIFNFRRWFKRIGFIKPVGQRYLEEDGFKIDEDTILIEETLKLCQIKCTLKDMSPVAVEKGFTEKYIHKPDRQAITKQIRQSFQRVAQGRNLMIIEGTGHAGVGSVFDHSNAHVAKLLGSKVILISSGGIGRPIDEIVLNKALFEKEGVRLLGVIINKVMPEKLAKINDLVRKGLRYKGVDVLGVVPYNPILSYPTIRQVLEETDFELLPGSDGSSLDNRASRVIVGAMHPKDASKYIVDQSLLITPGDREDILRLVCECHKQGPKVSGIILTGGLMPSQELMQQLKERGVPVLLSQLDTYTVASMVSSLNVKIRPKDKEKIAAVEQMIHDYVDLDLIIKRL